eukprot:scaffold536_cov409-Prasinococcus_capsulatus_cf.AAC.13
MPGLILPCFGVRSTAPTVDRPPVACRGTDRHVLAGPGGTVLTATALPLRRWPRSVHHPTNRSR